MVACRQGDVDAALRTGARAPHAAGLQRALAQALVALGRTGDAADVLRRALALKPDLELFEALTATLMPGPSYYQHLQWLQELARPNAYLEIGVWYGQSLGLAKPPTRAFGVDPDPKLDRAGLTAETRIYPMTSDAFFAELPWLAQVGAVAFDLAFIDGLHLFEQVLRDFVNVERHCSPDGIVVFHDTLPPVAIAAERAPAGPFWCGDVWKILPCLERYRPDLRIVTLPTAPSGLSIVTGLNPGSTVLADRFDEAVAEIGALPFAVLDQRLPELIARRSNDRNETARAIGIASS